MRAATFDIAHQGTAHERTAPRRSVAHWLALAFVAVTIV